jgi:nucleotide-binding universal stress UspA family protein
MRESGADRRHSIVHLTPPAESIPLDASAVSFADAATMKLEATCKLEEMAIKVRNCGVTCNFIVSQGSPQHVLPELVQRVNADRLILGTHGRQHLKRLLLGSVAQEIFNSVDLPVCTIGPRAHTAPARGIPERILHPVSLRQGFEYSARLALEMAQFYQAEVTLLHVLDRAQHLGYEPERVAEWTRLELRRLIPDEATLWTYVNAQVEMGGVVDHVLNVAAEMQADLIVLGVDGGGSFWPVQNHYTSHLSSNHREARRDNRTVSDRARVCDRCIRRHVLIVTGTVWAAGEQSSSPGECIA